MQPGQMVHASVAFCKKYRPKALLPSNTELRNWDGLVDSGNKFATNWTQGWEDLLEMDIFDASTADMVIQRIQDSSANPIVWVHRLTVMTWTRKFVHRQNCHR